MSKKTKLIAFIVALVLILESEVVVYLIGNANLKKKYKGKSSGKDAATSTETGIDPDVDPDVDPGIDPIDGSEAMKVTWKSEEESLHYTEPSTIYRNGIPCYIDASSYEKWIVSGHDIITWLDDNREAFGFESAKENFRVVGSKRNELTQNNYYTVQQTYLDYDVYGHQLIAMVDKDYHLHTIRGDFYPNITLSQTELDEKAICEQYATANNCEILSSKEVIYIVNDQPQLVVEMITLEGANSSIVFVNADGAVVGTETLVSTLGEDEPDSDFTYTDTDGTAYTINVKKASDEDHYYFYDGSRNIYVISNNFFVPGEEYDITKNTKFIKQLLALMKLPHWNLYNISNSLFKKLGTFDFTVNANGGFEIPLRSDEYTTAAVRNNSILMKTFEDVYDFYERTVAIKGPYDNGDPIYISNRVTVTDGSAYQNASFYSGCNVYLIGDPYISSEDACAHEWNHGCFFTIVGTPSTPYTQSINEAYSDIAAVCMDADDWDLAENSGSIVRHISDPTLDEHPVEVGGEFFVEAAPKGYDPHINSSIISYSAYLMSEGGAFESRDQMFQVFYNSMFYLTPTANFEDCAYAVIDSAKDLGLTSDKIDIITQAFITTKVLVEDLPLTGYVVDDTTGEALSGVYVSITNAEGYSDFDITDESGKFEVYVKSTLQGELTILNTGYDALTAQVDENTSQEAEYRLIPTTDMKNIELVFVMDNSASMRTSDPSEDRKTIISSMLALVSNSNIQVADGLVTFTAVSNLVTSTLNQNTDKNASILNLYQIVTDDGGNSKSGTCGAEGLLAGMGLFSDNADTSRYIIFLSDGEDNREGSRSYDELINDCNAKGIRIYSIGLGSESLDEENLEKLAAETGGECFYTENSSGLTEIVQAIFYNLR